MFIVKKLAPLKTILNKTYSARRSIGFVPTMGDLHEGHLSLIRKSKKENDFTVVSIFVNPVQFDSRKDFLKYSRNEKRDCALLKKEKVDLVFLPGAEEIYPSGFQTWVTVENLSRGLCGEFRPCHFRGVTTVVLKLFELVKPSRAYFGLKDYQQFKIIERMVQDLNLSVLMIPCPTVREPDGLAMSSRNSRLSSEERRRSARIYLGLKHLAFTIRLGGIQDRGRLNDHFLTQLKLHPKDKLEYLEFVHPKTLVPLNTVRSPVLIACAVWIGGTRLIDNLLITPAPLPHVPFRDEWDKESG